MPRSPKLVLTAAPGSGVVTESITEAARGALSAEVSNVRWLAPGSAWSADVDLRPGATSGARDTVAAALAPAPIDVNVVVSSGDAGKRLLCADMESTIIAQEMLDEMAALIGCESEIAAITAAAMRGELDFEASLVRRVSLFEGLSAECLTPLLSRMTPMPGAEALVSTMRAQGANCALVTGGFTFFAEPVASRLGFDAVVANTLEIVGGKLTGRVTGPIIGPNEKAQALRHLASEQGLALNDTLAVGDGANDLAMLAAAGLGVAYRAKPILRAAALQAPNGAVVTHGDLTALLHLQDYAHETFAI